MSAIALTYARLDRPGNAVAVRRMLDAMLHHGPDGADIRDLGLAILGHCHFWTTPEEVGERQPLSDPGSGLSLVWDGRIDNRDDLYRALSPGALPPLVELSDATLFLRHYVRYGVTRLATILGSYSFAVYDSRNREVTVGRDLLGNRCVFYALDATLLVVASEESGILAHPAIALKPRESALVEVFAASPSVDGNTIFDGVKQLLPGHLLRVSANNADLARYGSVDPAKRIRYRTETEYAEHFAHVLDESVRSRLRCTGRPASTLSGGLDSGPITALAARHLAGSTSAEPLIAISWVFDEHRECDERRYFRGMYDAHRIHPLQVPCDDAWPLSDMATWPVHPGTPIQDAYRRFRERSYQSAREHGVRVLLSGMLGDLLYLGTERWFLDLVNELGWKAAAHDAKRYSKNHGIWNFIKRQVIRPVVPGWLPGRRQCEFEWLTKRARRILPRGIPFPVERVRAQRPTQYGLVLDLLNSQDSAIESYFASRYRIECRYPFRDRRLVEFMLAVPTSQLYRRGIDRPIMRNAMFGLLPEDMIVRDGKTSFESVFDQGIYDRECQTVRSLLDSPDASWNNYVDSQWLAVAPPHRSAAILWYCVSFELWCRNSPVGREFKRQLSTYD